MECKKGGVTKAEEYVKFDFDYLTVKLTVASKTLENFFQKFCKMHYKTNRYVIEPYAKGR